MRHVCVMICDRMNAHNENFWIATYGECRICLNSWAAWVICASLCNADDIQHVCVFHVSRLMCWFGARWNVQRNVTCIVICTIPWTNWHVNTYRYVWAHPAHVCFSVNCIKSQTQCEHCIMCVSVMQDSCNFVLVHMCMGMPTHKSQVNRGCAVKKRLHTAHRAVLTVLRARSGLRPRLSRSVCSWSHACTPAKFKHIGKRRNTHNVVCLQSLRTNKNYIAAPIICMRIELLYTYVMPILVWV
jgi:hypothetical protein